MSSGDEIKDEEFEKGKNIIYAAKFKISGPKPSLIGRARWRIQDKEFTGNQIRIGRNRKSDWRIKQAGVAEEHAVIEIKNPAEMYLHPTITHKTLLNDNLVEETVQIHEGDEIQIGDQKLRLIWVRKKMSNAGFRIGLASVALLCIGFLALALSTEEERRAVLEERGIPAEGYVFATERQEVRRSNTDSTDYRYLLHLHFQHPERGMVSDEALVSQSKFFEYRDASARNPMPVVLVVDPESDLWMLASRFERGYRIDLIVMGIAAIFLLLFILYNLYLMLYRSQDDKALDKLLGY